MPKRDLYFRTPIMNAAGMLGFAPDLRAWQNSEVSEAFGAFVTNPLSMRPRKPTSHPATVEYPGGFLLHTGLPNPGFSAAVKRYAHKWVDSSLPIIVHLMADRPEETKRMVESLEGISKLLFARVLAHRALLSAPRRVSSSTRGRKGPA